MAARLLRPLITELVLGKEKLSVYQIHGLTWVETSNELLKSMTSYVARTTSDRLSR